MNQQPDKLFREKLETLGQPAPAGAWSRIEEGLPKKKHNRIWLRVAAALLLAGAVSYLIWPVGRPDTVQPLVSENDPLKEDALMAAEENRTEKETDTERQESANNTPAPAEKITSPAHGNRTERTAALSPAPPQKRVEPAVSPQSASAVEDALVTQPETAVAAMVEESSEEKNFKLVIDADEANDKYLNKKSLAQATTEEQKTSGLKRLLHKAYDLKTNQNSLGELRQMKNEILALNFQGNKKQEQNK